MSSFLALSLAFLCPSLPQVQPGSRTHVGSHQLPPPETEVVPLGLVFAVFGFLDMADLQLNSRGNPLIAFEAYDFDGNTWGSLQRLRLGPQSKVNELLHLVDGAVGLIEPNGNSVLIFNGGGSFKYDIATGDTQPLVFPIDGLGLARTATGLRTIWHAFPSGLLVFDEGQSVGHALPLNSPCSGARPMSSDGRIIVGSTSSPQQPAYLVNLGSPIFLPSFGSGSACSVSPSGDFVLGADQAGACVWNLAQGTQVSIGGPLSGPMRIADDGLATWTDRVWHPTFGSSVDLASFIIPQLELDSLTQFPTTGPLRVQGLCMDASSYHMLLIAGNDYVAYYVRIPRI